MDKSTVKYIANLSRLEIEDTQIEKFSDQLSKIVGYVEKLNNLDLENVEPFIHVGIEGNVLREDECEKSLSTQKALSNAPLKDESFFLVPKVIE